MKTKKRKGPGRPPGPTGKELKERFSVRAYPSDITALKEIDSTIQMAVDVGVPVLLKMAKR